MDEIVSNIIVLVDAHRTAAAIHLGAREVKVDGRTTLHHHYWFGPTQMNWLGWRRRRQVPFRAGNPDYACVQVSKLFLQPYYSVAVALHASRKTTCVFLETLWLLTN